MNKCISILILLFNFSFFAQTNSEVYLFDIKSEYGELAVFNMQNISNDAGYDSQPSFATNNRILFAGNNNGQTDIASYDIVEKTKTWFNIPTEGSEYSPTLIPLSQEKVAAVRLDSSGLQRLYEYDSESRYFSEIIEGLQVAYYAHSTKNRIVSSVLGENGLYLVLSDLTRKRNDTILQNVGRSIHKVHNSFTMSYTLINEEENQEIYLLDFESRESFFVCQLPIGIQDFTWLNDSQIIIGSGSKLFVYDTFLNSKWVQVADLSDYHIKEITRLAVSPDGSKLAIVAEPN